MLIFKSTGLTIILFILIGIIGTVINDFQDGKTYAHVLVFVVLFSGLNSCLYYLLRCAG